MTFICAEERKRLLREYIPWANQAGKQATCLMNVYYEHEFETPLDDLRRRLNILTAPSV